MVHIKLLTGVILWKMVESEEVAGGSAYTFYLHTFELIEKCSTIMYNYCKFKQATYQLLLMFIRVDVKLPWREVGTTTIK